MRGPAAKHRKILPTIAARVGNKSGISEVLSILYDEGLLTESFGDVRKKIAREIRSATDVPTPYGSLVKHFELDNVRFEYICPCAWLFYMCSISSQFALLLKISVAVGAASFVLYNDGVVPGNPFRPDKARKVEAFYWNIVELPDYVLQRSMCWPTLTLIRTSVIGNLIGQLPRLMCKLLWIMDRLSTGISSIHVLMLIRLSFGLLYSLDISISLHRCVSCSSRDVINLTKVCLTRMDNSCFVANSLVSWPIWPRTRK